MSNFSKFDRSRYFLFIYFKVENVSENNCNAKRARLYEKRIEHFNKYKDNLFKDKYLLEIFLLLVTFSTGVNSVGNRTRVIYRASMVRDKRINEKEERRKNCEIEM